MYELDELFERALLDQAEPPACEPLAGGDPTSFRGDERSMSDPRQAGIRRGSPASDRRAPERAYHREHEGDDQQEEQELRDCNPSADREKQQQQHEQPDHGLTSDSSLL